MRVDDDLCTETFLGNLISYLPTKDDKLDVMKKYLEGPPEACEELDTPEQFTVEVVSNAPVIHFTDTDGLYRCIGCTDMSNVYSLCYSEFNSGKDLINWKRYVDTNNANANDSNLPSKKNMAIVIEISDALKNSKSLKSLLCVCVYTYLRDEVDVLMHLLYSLSLLLVIT